MKKTVFLTGASGTMGFQAFRELYNRRNMFNITVLLLADENSKQKFREYENDPSVKIVWGDLVNYEDVLECVTGSD